MTDESVRGLVMMTKRITREERKQQLIDIALEQFATVGYTKTKISDIVALAGVSQGTFYWHFKSKEEIALYILERGNQQILQMISLGFQNTRVPVEQSVNSSTRLFEALFHFAEENRFFTMLLFKGLSSEELLQQQILRIKKNMEEAFVHNIQQAQKFHMIAEHKNPKVLAVFIMSLIEGVLSRWVDHEAAFQELTLEELVQQTVHFEFFGIFGV